MESVVPLAATLEGEQAEDTREVLVYDTKQRMMVLPLALPEWKTAGRGGFAVNHMDVAPRYAGAVMALSNTAGTLAGVVAVSLTGALLESAGDDAVRGWRGATGVAAAVLVAAGAFFVGCASGEKLFGELDGY